MSEHTPTPWRVELDEDNQETTFIVSGEPDPWFIAEMKNGCDHYDKYSDTEHPEDTANAHFNVLACNLHDEMREALGDAVGVMTEPGIMDVDEWKAWYKRTIAAIRAILAKTQKGDD